MIILVMGLTSAFEFDNTIRYDKEDMQVTLTNANWLGIGDFLGISEDLGTAELKSHKFVDEAVGYGLGNKVVMWYETNWKDKYVDGFGVVEITDMRTGKLIQRDYQLMIGTEVTKDTYGCANPQTTGSWDCDTIVIGTKQVIEWREYNSKDIPKEKALIGVQIEMKSGDHLDLVWTLAGKKIKKHAQVFAFLDLGDQDNAGGTVSTREGITITVQASSTIHNVTLHSSPNSATRVYLYIRTGSGAGNVIATADISGRTATFTDATINNSYQYFIVADNQGASYTRTYYTAGSPQWWPQNNGQITGIKSVIIGGSEFDDWLPNIRSIYTYTGTADSPPTSTLNAPANNTIQYASSFNLNGTGTDDQLLQNMSLIVSDIRESTNSSPINNTLTNFEYTASIGTFIWKIETCDNASICVNSSERYITYSNDLVIALNSPVNEFNSTSQTLDFNGTPADDTGVVNVSYILNGIYNGTDSSITNNTLVNFERTLAEGKYNWTMEVCDAVSCENATARNFTIDSRYPQINISAPTNGQNFPYLVSLNNITLNITAIDNNLDTCWKSYNGTNTTLSCTNATVSTNNLTLTNESIIDIWVNDTFGLLNSSTSDWTYDLFDFNNYTYDVNITESSPATFIGNFQTGTSISSTYLTYNNTNYSVSINSLGGNRYILSSIITTPTVVTDTNITWFFWVNNINATQFNQTVLNVGLDDCDSYTNYVINYTLVDELTQDEISNVNSTIESLVYLKTLTGELVAQFNQTFNGTATPSICSQENLNESSLRLWEQSRYGSTNYVYEQHNLQNASMTSLPNKITLRDLPSDSATTFRITYKSSTFLPVQDAVIDFQRKYIGEGIFKSIESPITDANGEISISLDLNAVIYRVIVSENGITLATFENPAIACDNILTGDCTINLNERQTVNLINTFDVINDFSYGLMQDNRTITLTFEIPSGVSRTINLFVNQSTILGDSTSCNQTVLATSGQLQCEISPTLGDVFASAKVSSDGTSITTASATILEDRSQYFGTDYIVLTFFLVLSLVLLMVSSPITVLIGLVIGIMASSLMLFLNAGSVFGVTSIVMYLVIIVIILIIKISKRER